MGGGGRSLSLSHGPCEREALTLPFFRVVPPAHATPPSPLARASHGAQGASRTLAGGMLWVPSRSGGRRGCVVCGRWEGEEAAGGAARRAGGAGQALAPFFCGARGGGAPGQTRAADASRWGYRRLAIVLLALAGRCVAADPPIAGPALGSLPPKKGKKEKNEFVARFFLFHAHPRTTPPPQPPAPCTAPPMNAWDVPSVARRSSTPGNSR